jgi:hypothetical protein
MCHPSHSVPPAYRDHLIFKHVFYFTQVAFVAPGGASTDVEGRKFQKTSVCEGELYPGLTIDPNHLAVMEQHGIERILTFDFFDSGFDGFPGVTRLT